VIDAINRPAANAVQKINGFEKGDMDDAGFTACGFDATESSIAT
jgi:hypothetical protein